MIKTFIIFSFVLFSTGLMGQESNSKFLGGWQVNVPETLSRIEGSMRAKYDSLPDGIKARATASLEGREFTFRVNDEITISWNKSGERTTSKGTWTIKEGQLFISIEEKPVSFTYHFPSPETLIIRSSTKSGFFNILYFNKK